MGTADPIPGQTVANAIGKYRPIAELGQGGMANVYLTVARGRGGFNKLVVLKVLRPALARDPELLAMFLDEARLAARLNHPNVVQTNEVGEDHGTHFIAMEYLEGQTLSSILQRARSLARPMPLRLHLLVLVEALNGMQYAHDLTDFDGTPLHAVHRDVSPQNLIVTYDGQVKMLDFGIAKAVGNTIETQTGIIRGKLGYMAPEQVLSERLDRRTDIYAAGVMLWEAAVGRRLWAGRGEAAVLHRIANGEVPTPRSVKPDVPEELERICMKALSLKREDRYESAIALQRDLEDYLDTLGPRPTSRDLGRYLADAFSDLRLEIKRIIELQLTKTEPELAIFPSAGTGADASGASTTSTASRKRLDDAVARLSSTPPEVKSKDEKGAHTDASAALAAEAPYGRSARPAFAAIALVVLTAVFVAAWIALRPSPPLPRSTTESSAPAAAAPLASSVYVSVAAVPIDAHLFLDDRPLPANPYAERRTPDGARHVIRAEAPGFVTRTVDVTLDRDVNVVLPLEAVKVEPTARVSASAARAPKVAPAAPPPPVAPPAAIHAGAAPPDSSAPVTPPVTAPRSKPPPRALDPSNPYAQ
jgi:serine/threonine-protein kinase